MSAPRRLGSTFGVEHEPLFLKPGAENACRGALQRVMDAFSFDFLAKESDEHATRGLVHTLHGRITEAMQPWASDYPGVTTDVRLEELGGPRLVARVTFPPYTYLKTTGSPKKVFTIDGPPPTSYEYEKVEFAGRVLGARTHVLGSLRTVFEQPKPLEHDLSMSNDAFAKLMRKRRNQ